MSIPDYHQESFYHYIDFVCLVLFFSFIRPRPVLFEFTQSSWIFQSLVLGNPSSSGYQFYLMEWVFSQISYRLVIHTSFVPPLSHHILQAEHHYRPKDLWLGWCLYLHLFWQCTVCFIFYLYQRFQNIGAKVPYRYQLDISMLNELCTCYNFVILNVLTCDSKSVFDICKSDDLQIGATRDNYVEK